MSVGNGWSCTLDIERSIHASLIWYDKQHRGEETKWSPGREGACWYKQSRLHDVVEHDADTTKMPALKNCTRWNSEWLVNNVDIDGIKWFGQTAAAVYTGTIFGRG